jgi:tetratricopeptide (TPR) repeat protein
MRFLPLIALLPPLLAGCINPERPDDGQPAPLDTRLEGERQVTFLRDYATLLVSRGRYDEAGRILESLRRSHPDDLEVIRKLAELYEGRGQPELALLAWDRVRLRSGDERDAAEYARVALLNRRFDEAEAVFQAWLDSAPPMSPRWLMALNNLGYSRLLQDDHERARVYFEQVLVWDPLHTRARANLDSTLRASWQKEEQQP